MDSSQVATGFIRGTGAAVNVPIGFVPDYVQLMNLTDGSPVLLNPLATVLAFTSGSTEIKQGDVLHGNSSDATAKVDQVIVDSGTWAGGDAAGWIILDPVSAVGAFTAAETAYRDGVDADTTDNLTLTAEADQDGINIAAAAVATTTPATGIIAYAGTRGGDAKGFTIGATASTNAKLFFYIALRGRIPLDQTVAP